VNEQITAIILAGGQGSRFNNCDKGWIEWQQKPFIEHVIERLKPQVKAIVINCNRNLERYQALGFPVCQDQLDDFQGPLAGVQAALPLVTTDYALICPVDSPLLASDLAERLFEPLQSAAADIAFPNDGQRSHFIPLLLKTRLKDSLDQYLAGDDRRVRSWFEQHRALEVDYSSNPEAFQNINDQQSLQQLDQL
jgi:molybdopterin-guanine dinucleotide biosynthesis protein A